MTAELSLDALERLTDAAKPHPSGYGHVVVRKDDLSALIAAARTKSPEPRPLGEEVAAKVIRAAEALVKDYDRNTLPGVGARTPAINAVAELLKIVSTLSAEREAMEGAQVVEWRMDGDDADGGKCMPGCAPEWIAVPVGDPVRDAFVAGWWVNAASPGEDGAADQAYFDGCAEADWNEYRALQHKGETDEQG